MSLGERKQHLIDQISTIQDENILIMLEEELTYYLESKSDTSELSPTDIKELISLANEEPGKDTISLEEFNRLTDKWRTK